MSEEAPMKGKSSLSLNEIGDERFLRGTSINPDDLGWPSTELLLYLSNVSPAKEASEDKEPELDVQLELDDEVLDASIKRTLYRGCPKYDEHYIEYCHKENCYMFPAEDECTFFICYEEGTLFHFDSPAAILDREIKEYEEALLEAEEFNESWDDSLFDYDEADEDEGEGEEEEEAEDSEILDGETEGEVIGEESEKPEDEESEGHGRLKSPAGWQKKKLRNKFNFSERGSQTYNPGFREDSAQTDPPPVARAIYQVSQYNIYDKYEIDYDVVLQEMERERKEKLLLLKGRQIERKKISTMETEDPVGYRMIKAVKMLERMVYQNVYDDFVMDLLYYDDPADNYKKAEGSAMPLWYFGHVESEGRRITDLFWSSRYPDLFAVTFGASDSSEPVGDGCIVLYTLKNPSFPEYLAHYPCGIMCGDFHPVKARHVACGLHDGSVIVYNVKNVFDRTPSHTSNVHTKHQGTVWQVKWGNHPNERNISFYSTSIDGDVFKWTLVQNELIKSDVITVYYTMDKMHDIDGVHFDKVIARGTCLTFHPNEHEIFLVGTAEGLIYKCSVVYSATYLFVYKAHVMPIRKVNINSYNPSIFISCSHDETVKVWEDCRSLPLHNFHLESPVEDVQWAGYSSTVFAAVTRDGNVQIYDLSINRHDAVCIQIVADTDYCQPTRLQFHNRYPFLLVGDSVGNTQSLKVSPNLRIKPKPPKKAGYIDPHTLETRKLQKVLSYVLELPVIDPVDHGDI